MKILDVVDGGSRGRCPVREITAPVKSEELYEGEGGQDYEWVRVTFSTMQKLIIKYDCFFDQYGNLCSEHGAIAPYSFKYLGKTLDVKVGCGFSMDETDWIKEE